MRFTLNGSQVDVEVEAGTSLLDLLRDGFGIRSVKEACAPEGSCGACTVLIDGHAVVSCTHPAEKCAGHEVVTVEGLAPEIRRLWAETFVAEGAVQCGFCTPGVVMKAEALLRRLPCPTRPEIAHALAGNLCRCTGYVKIVEAIEAVAAVRRGEVPVVTPAPAGSGAGDGPVGARAPRLDGHALVLGTKPFVGDMKVPGMLHGALRLADHPRAVVRRIDISRAAAHPGVVCIASARDVPGKREQGLIVADWPPFIAEGETTRCVGDVLVAVAAETRHVAREAAALIDVEYEVLEPVTDPFAALAPDAPRIHEAGNLLSTSVVRRGDVDAALATSAHVLTETFRTPSIEHAFLEPEACLVEPSASDPGRPKANVDAAGAPLLHVYSQGQGAWEDRRQIASFLGLPQQSVRVTQVATGGGFGGKEDLSVQAQTALLALLSKRPVLLRLSRKESIRLHPKRHAMSMTYTVGCDAEGRLTAVRARIVGDTGAYASVGGKVLERAAGHACGPYRVANVDVEAKTVYTNNPPAGAMRGFGAVQVSFAVEGMLDRLAERVGLDGWEIRWRNALETGDRFATGQLLGPGVGLKRTLLAVRDAYHSSRFAGIACGAKNVGLGNGVVEYGRAILRPEADGTVTLFHSWSEMGQGVHTIMRQVAAQELGIAPERIHVIVDTERELDTAETTASRATSLGGQAVIDAARRLRAALGERRLEDLAGQEFRGEFIVDWTTPNEAPEPVTHFAYGWASQVVILDETGKLARVVAAHDAGRVMNPTAMEGQIQGGVHMGLGYALTEQLVLQGGFPVTDTLKSLDMIPAAGMPPVECILVEEQQPEGPYGAKGAGEAVLVPTAGAVAGALYAFDGLRRTALPMRDSAAARAAAPHIVPHAAHAAAGAATVETHS